MAAKHTHQYIRRNNGVKKEVWVMACALPECSHYVYMSSKLSAPILIGKLSLCNDCKEEYLLDRRAIRMSKPICAQCAKGNTKEIKKTEDFFANLEKEIMDDPT